MRSFLPILAAVLLALVLGFLVGRIFTILTFPVPATTIREDTRPIIPVVEITGAENGKLRGSIRGEARVFVGDTYVIPNASGAFIVAATDLVKTISAPPSGMRFVASRRGRKYYPVTSPSGQRLAPENRVYFATAQEAEAAGYEAP